MKRVTITYFASLKEQATTRKEVVESKANTLLELYEELSQKHGFCVNSQTIRIACNDVFREPNDTFASGDFIAFLPPVSGG